jgi:signal transduction histidine kinase
MKFTRKLGPWIYVGVLAVSLVVMITLFGRYGAPHPEALIETLYLSAAVALMNIPSVRIDRGRLSLNGVISWPAAILLNPLDATIVGLAAALVVIRRREPWPLLGNAVMYAAGNCLGSIVANQLRAGNTLSFGSRIGVIVTVIVVNLTLVAFALAINTGEPPFSVIRHNFTPSFFAAFGYSALAALLISYVLDGTLLGYVLATIVCVLALALTDTIAGRRLRLVLESELSDADRHLFHSRAVEGVVHNLRNHVATAVGYLREIDLRRLDPVDRESVETATAAANDAVTVLRDLSQGATPRVSYAPDPVDLNELVTRAIGMARPRARTKAVQLAVRETPDEVKVRADPLLLREVITNLVNNAIDAAPQNGHVEATTGRRVNGWPFVTVADDGPGVSDDNRHRLFEPHFSTKEGGTGLGLFMSYGIVREHQGQLIYEGNRRGGVFTVALPPFGG